MSATSEDVDASSINTCTEFGVWLSKQTQQTQQQRTWRGRRWRNSKKKKAKGAKERSRKETIYSEKEISANNNQERAKIYSSAKPTANVAANALVETESEQKQKPKQWQ